jgi:hypothetical protein
MSKKQPTDLLVTPAQIESMVRVVRGQRVMLDFDLARLYGVTTAALNQAVQRNADRFPEAEQVNVIKDNIQFVTV